MAGLATLSCYCCLLNALLGLGVFNVRERFVSLGQPLATLLVTVVAGVTFAAARQILALAGVPEKEAAQLDGPRETRESLLGKTKSSVSMVRYDIPELPGLVQIAFGQSWWRTSVAFASLLLCVIYLVQVCISLAYHFAYYLSLASRESENWFWWTLLGFVLVLMIGNCFSIKQIQLGHVIAALLRFVFIGLLITLHPTNYTDADSSSNSLCSLLALPILLIAFQYQVTLPQVVNIFSPGAAVNLQGWVVGSAWALSMLIGWAVGIKSNLLAVYCDQQFWSEHLWVPRVCQVLISVHLLSCAHIHFRVLGGILIGKVYDPNLEYARDTHSYGVRFIYLALPPLLCSFIPFDYLMNLNILRNSEEGVDSAAVVTLVLVFLVLPYCYLKQRGQRIGWLERVGIYVQYLLLLTGLLIAVVNQKTHFAILLSLSSAGVMLLLLLFEFISR